MAYIHTDLPFDLLEDADPEGLINNRKKQEEVDNKKLYEILEIPQNATLNEIKKSYQQLARKNHPDKGGNKEKFQEIQNAYRILSDQEKRDVYDKYGLEAVDKRNLESGNIFDMFSQEKKEKVQKMDPINHEEEITLKDAYCGSQILIKKTRNRICSQCQGWGGSELIECQECEGQGRKDIVKNIGVIGVMYQKIQVQCDTCQQTGKVYKPETRCSNCKGMGILSLTKEIQVTIQKGAYNGLEIVLYGEGEEKLNIMAGDLIVTINIEEHGTFERVGADLKMEMIISLKEALCGFQRQITHLDESKFQFKVKPGQIRNQPFQMTLKNKGMPFFNDEMSHGNMFIEFKIAFPDRLSNEQIQQLLKSLPGPGIINENFLRLERDNNERNPNPQGGQKKEEDDDNQSGQRIACAQQ